MDPFKTPKALEFRMPAEWEPHQATWLSWPKDPVTWPDRVPQAQEVFAQMIEALSLGEKVHLLVDDAQAEQEVRKKLQEKKPVWENMSFHQLPTVDSWIRDYGPNFLVGSGENAGKLAYNDWIFNAWGGKYESLMADDAIPKKLESFLHLPRFETGIVLEGGSIDVNGKGSLLTTEQCLLNKNRNPQLSQEEIEGYLKNFLGVEQILWLGEGIAGDDTDGHVDDITRFVAADKIVTVLEADPADENHRPLQENLKRLQAMRDLQGRPFKIATLPMPGPVYSDEGRLPASYGNFYIANSVVLVPIFGHQNDVRALEVLRQLFPSRRVYGIRCEDLVWGMGAIHCVTQQQPAI